MKKRLTACMLACFMILLVGCSSNTAKEAAKNETKTETSFPAGNTETQSQKETSTEQESTVVQEKTPNTTDESKKADESKTISDVQSKPAEEKSPEKPKVEQSKQTKTPTTEKQTEQSKEPTSATPKPTEKPKEPKPTKPPKQTFDVSEYVSYAKNYAQSIGLVLDCTATECWDNPISANPNRSGIKSDIESRLNRYKNSEGVTSVWIWTEKQSDTDYDIYIGYC